MRSGSEPDNGVFKDNDNEDLQHHATESEKESKLNDQTNDGSKDKAHVEDRLNEKMVKRTAPVSKVIELERRFRTRYIAWMGLLLLWLASLAAVLLRGDATEWLLVASLSLVILTSGLLPVFAAYGLSYTRIMSTTTIEQGKLQVTLKLLRKFPIPGVWYGIHDQLINKSTMRGQKLKLQAWFMPLFHRQMEISYHIHEMERGSYNADTATISIGDWLGLTCITLQREQPTACIVLPQLQVPEEESYVARHTSSTWMKRPVKETNTAAQDGMSATEQKKIRQKLELENGSQEWHREGTGLATRPYAAGDSYRRIDNRAAARGLGLHIRTSQADESSPKLCFLLDQYDLPYQEEQQDQMFHSLVNWCLVDVLHAGEQQTVSVVSDDWCFQYLDEQHINELKYLLALVRPDVTMQMKDRIPFLTPLLPNHGHITVYSGAWKDSEGWLALAEAAWLKGSSLEVQFVTNNRVMTYAMREQQKILESAGIQLVWRYSFAKPSSVIEVKQRSEHHAASTNT